jgi:hypothetical protein
MAFLFLLVHKLAKCSFGQGSKEMGKIGGLGPTSQVDLYQNKKFNYIGVNTSFADVMCSELQKSICFRQNRNTHAAPSLFLICCFSKK